jgi:transcriptional regulator
MNRVPAFEIMAPEVIARLIRDLAFAQVVTQGADGFEASGVPLLLDEAEDGPWRLRGHLARSNPQARIGGAEVAALALFLGPHAYVSPSSYATKAETGKVVPTWNYIEVLAHGRLRLTDDAGRTLAAVTDLTDAHEADRDERWRVSDAPDGYVEGLARGIVSFELVVERIEAKAKLSQNKSEADRLGVIGDLTGRTGGAPEVARLMESGEFDRPDR